MADESCCAEYNSHNITVSMCDNEVIDEYKNVTVKILRCKKCGKIVFEWS